MAEKRAHGGGRGRARWRERAASAVVDKAFGCDGGAIYIVEGATLCVVGNTKQKTHKMWSPGG